MHSIIKRTLKRNDNAISPVIGTILMVAATVIIAGAVYAAVNAYNGKAAKPAPDAAFKAQAVDTDGDGLEDMVKLTYISGPSGANNVYANVAGTGALTVSAGTSPGSGGGTWDPGDYQTFDGLCVSPCTASSAAGAYFVTVTMGDNTILDQMISLKE